MVDLFNTHGVAAKVASTVFPKGCQPLIQALAMLFVILGRVGSCTLFLS